MSAPTDMSRSTQTGSARSAAAPRVWAIGGGKGGIGKSAIAANLGVILAQQDHRVVLIDVDLGGANLHTMLGVPAAGPTIADFLIRRRRTLEEVMVPTNTAGLTLISGNRAPVEMANPRYAQKLRLLRNIAALPVDHVILDLGAGSSFNVLDFFLAAEHGVLVVVPEATSVENAYHFLKAAFFRKLKWAEPRDRVKAAVTEAMAQRESLNIRSPRDLLRRVTEVDPIAGEGLLREARGFDPALVVNRTQRPEHRQLGLDMELACEDYFGRKMLFLGTIDEDELLARSVRDRRPAAVRYPECRFVAGLRKIADRLVGVTEAVRGA
jgi:flagellar biosynthesis protein FlhG